MSATVAAAAVLMAGDIEQTWTTLTSRTLAARWWGEFDHDIDRVAGEVIVRTGSTSFYRLWIDELEPPTSIRMTSAFLGVSPMTTVRIELSALPEGVRVHVIEELAAADPAGSALATDLWWHRLEALRRIVEQTSAAADDDLLSERTLPNPRWRPLHTANIGQWLPVSGPEFPPRQFFIVDSDGARPFPISNWHADYDERVSMRVVLATTGPASRIEMTVRESDGVVRIAVAHTGWSDLALDREVRQVLRSRFRATWRLALDNARSFGESS